MITILLSFPAYMIQLFPKLPGDQDPRRKCQSLSIFCMWSLFHQSFSFVGATSLHLMASGRCTSVATSCSPLRLKSSLLTDATSCSRSQERYAAKCMPGESMLLVNHSSAIANSCISRLFAVSWLLPQPSGTVLRILSLGRSRALKWSQGKEASFYPFVLICT